MLLLMNFKGTGTARTLLHAGLCRCAELLGSKGVTDELQGVMLLT
jgi:hypothetical protein